MSFKHGLLGILGYGSMTGYEVDKVVKVSLSFFWQAKTSQVYRELDAMEKIGWLSSERIVQRSKPNKRVYSLTDKGREEFENWLNSQDNSIADAMSVKNAFLMKIFFGGEMTTDKTLAMLESYKTKCMESKHELGRAYHATEEFGNYLDDQRKVKFWKLSILYGEIFYEAGIDWANRAIDILSEEDPK